MLEEDAMMGQRAEATKVVDLKEELLDHIRNAHGLSVALFAASLQSDDLGDLARSIIALVQDPVGKDVPWVRYRNRPVTIDARCATEEEYVLTPEGIRYAHPGDWIIRGIRGQLYVIGAESFERLYEPIGSGR